MTQDDRSSRSLARWPGLLRPNGVHSDEVEPIELFFDLVYVLAITQLTHYLIEHQSWHGALETLALLFGVWAGWINVVWITNYFDVEARALRLTLLAAMLVGLVMSSSIPDALENRGLAFALPVTLLLAGSPAWGAIGVGKAHPLRPVFDRIVIWWCGIGAVWIAGAFAGRELRLLLWLVAGIATLVVVYAGFPLPHFGHNVTRDYTISGGHIAERCLLFIILALGESILITGENFGEIPHDLPAWCAFVVAFAGSGALWWIYFDRAEALAREKIVEADDPGRLGVVVYTFLHIPLVAGILISAAGDEISIAHPEHHATTAEALLILGGPVIFLAGHFLVKYAAFGFISLFRLAGALLLAGLLPIAHHLTNMQLAALATAVLIGVALTDYRITRSWSHPEPHGKR